MVGHTARGSVIRTLITFGLLVLTAGCTVDVVDPNSGLYRCETPRDCAEGYYCSVAGYCIADGAPDPSDASDATDSADASDVTQTSDPTDTSDATDESDSADASDASESTDPTDATDATDGSDSTDASDASESTDPTDTSDATDNADPSSTTTPVCGDGTVAWNEECDDGNDDNTDSCLNNCMIASCGDGYVYAELETCDDGLQNSDSWSQDAHCNATCTALAPHCGDGMRQGLYEDCDTSGQDTVTCNAICTTSQCGDLYVNAVAGEACDDGNLDNTDACISCVAATCGDGFIHDGVEDCDDSNTATEACAYGEESCTVCTSTCQDGAGVTSFCGDGELDAGNGEVCDDGALNSDDYRFDGAITCNAACSGNAAYCGDNAVNGPEECDDADSDNTDACPNTCLDATCGDGFTHEGIEACDDGNDNNQDNCLDTCVVASCGDGFTWNEGEGTETCDDTNTVTEVCAYGAESCTVCSAQCQEVAGATSRCGDNVVDSDEDEVCDGDTVTCSSLGFGNGDVACLANCSGYQTCPSTESAILSFGFEASFNGALTEDISATIDVTAVSLVVPIGTSRANLTASFTVSAGATVKVGSAVQQSGVTANDFSEPVIYTVVAEDGSELNYLVTVSIDETVPDGFVTIEAGTFTMGSPTDELGRGIDEVQHQVTLTRSFFMMEHEVTQSQWQALMGNNPSSFSSCGNDCPVEEVNWYEAMHYANALSEAAGYSACYVFQGCNDVAAGAGRVCSGVSLQDAAGEAVDTPYECQGYRLPTEAEWEYAYRAGTSTALYNGAMTLPTGADPKVAEIGWFDQNSENTTHAVKGKAANSIGLYDMSGNVWERVWDLYGVYDGDAVNPTGASSGTQCILRGGSWVIYARSARAASRVTDECDNQSSAIGFRVVRTAPIRSAKALYNFQFGNAENDALSEDVSATIEATAISLTVPTTSLTNLIASFTVSAGATVRVADVVQESGVTANDFSSPLTYVVTAEDGSKRTYTVTVSPDGFVLIEAGTFTMGSPESELGHESDETQHEVTLTNDLYLSDHEVMQAEWQALIGNNPSQNNNGSCDTCPVEMVNWWEALHYANALSESEGLTVCYVLSGCNGNAVGADKECTGVTLQDGDGNSVTIPYECEGYRLPTEAEWEYAARAGTTTAFYNGDITVPEGSDPNANDIAWYSQNSGDTTHAVKDNLLCEPETQLKTEKCKLIKPVHKDYSKTKRNAKPNYQESF